MYNSERRGTDAYYAMEEFVRADESFISAQSEMENAAENATTVISQLCDDVEEREEDIKELQKKVEELEAKLKVDDAVEFIRVLKNVQVYVADHIQVLEKKYGEGVKEKTEQPE